jgi:hypothetical protein
MVLGQYGNKKRRNAAPLDGFKIDVFQLKDNAKAKSI